LSKTGVIFSCFAISVFVLLSIQVHPAVFLIYFTPAAVILLMSPGLMVQFSLPYNRAQRAGVMYNFNLVFCGLNILLVFNLLSMSTSFS
jgi:hypothetical protein